MDKWKIVVIVLLLAGVAAYGWFNSNQSSRPPAPTPAEETKTADNNQQKLQALVGTSPRPWSIDKPFWVNAAQPIEPQDLNGQVAVLEFWRTGCSHCEQAVPFMNKLYADYKNRGVKLVTFQSPGLPDPSNPENNWQEVQSWIASHKIQYPVAFDAGSKVRSQYGVDLYPMILIINRQNRIVHAVSGHTPAKELEIIQALDKALQK